MTPIAIEDIVATYFRVWNAPTAAVADPLLARCVNPAVRYRDPWYVTEGIADLGARIRRAHTTAPGFRVFVSCVIDGYGDTFRYTWDFITADARRVSGLDIVTRDAEGRIETLTSFFGDLVPLAEGDPIRCGAPWAPAPTA